MAVHELKQELLAGLSVVQDAVPEATVLQYLEALTDESGSHVRKLSATFGHRKSGVHIQATAEAIAELSKDM